MNDKEFQYLPLSFVYGGLRGVTAIIVTESLIQCIGISNYCSSPLMGEARWG